MITIIYTELYESLRAIRFLNVSESFLRSPRLHLFEQKHSQKLIVWNIIIIDNTLKISFIPGDIKAEFSASLLQSSVSQDPSEIILISTFAA